MFISRFISKAVGEKGRRREYKARVRELPPNYRAAVEAVERYLLYTFAMVIYRRRIS